MSEKEGHEGAERTVDRRRLLRRAGTVAAGVAGAGVAGAVVASPASAAAGDPVLLGQANSAGASRTAISNASSAQPTLELSNTALDDGVSAGAPLRLVPSGLDISSAAPAGSVSADLSGNLLTRVEYPGGAVYTDFVYTSATALLTVPLPVPMRLLDTRTAAGRRNILNPSGNLDSSSRVLARKTIHLNLGEAVLGGFGVYGNLTVVSAAGAGFLTVFPYGADLPGTSNINYVASNALSNFTFSGIGYENEVLFDLISIYVSQTTHVIFDALAFLVPSYDSVGPFGASALSAKADNPSDLAFAKRKELAAKKLQQLRNNN